MTTTRPDPLPSWKDGEAKSAIIDFVERVTSKGSAGFMSPAERIATFDNDGTLWCEQPMQVQVFFLIDRVKELAAKDPAMKGRQPFKALLERDLKTLQGLGKQGLLELGFATHAGMTEEEFGHIAQRWLATAKHPKFQRPYTDLVYVPMQELLAYLRSNGFKTFIVSGGSIEFMRPWAEKAYGIPPEQVIGSQQDVKFELKDGKPVLTRAPKIAFVDDGPGKPVGIYRSIGKRPILAFGNSDGDWQMFQVTAAGDGPRFVGIVHHTDAEREFSYDRASRVGKLDKAWDDAVAKGWTIVDMKADWKRIFPWEP